MHLKKPRAEFLETRLSYFGNVCKNHWRISPFPPSLSLCPVRPISRREKGEKTREEGGRESAAEEGKNGQHTITIVLLSVCPALPLFSSPRCKRGEISRREATDSPSRERERVGEKEEARGGGEKIGFHAMLLFKDGGGGEGGGGEGGGHSGTRNSLSSFSSSAWQHLWSTKRSGDRREDWHSLCVCGTYNTEPSKELALFHPSKRLPRSRKSPKSFPQGKMTIMETFTVCRPTRAFVHRTHVGRRGMRRPFFLG